MRSGRIWSVLLVLGLAVVHSGAALATGSGFGGFGSPGAGDPQDVDDVYTSLDGSLEFSGFRFVGIDPDDVTIEIGESDITFSGESSLTGFGLDTFKISYNVRTLTDSGIIATSLGLDSQVDGSSGAVIATKRISAPREPAARLPWVSLHSLRDDDDHDHGRRSHGDWLGGGEFPSFEHIGTLIAYNIASGWICGCGHHHSQREDVESECRIEQDEDSIEYEPETVLHIEDTVKLFSIGKNGVTWRSLTNSYVATPEPGTASLLALGLVGLVASGRRRR